MGRCGRSCSCLAWRGEGKKEVSLLSANPKWEGAEKTEPGSSQRSTVRGNGKHEKFRVDDRENLFLFYHEGGKALEVERDRGAPSDIQVPAEHSPEQPGVGGPALSRDWTRATGPFQPGFDLLVSRPTLGPDGCWQREHVFPVSLHSTHQPTVRDNTYYSDKTALKEHTQNQMSLTNTSSVKHAMLAQD